MGRAARIMFAVLMATVACDEKKTVATEPPPPPSDGVQPVTRDDAGTAVTRAPWAVPEILEIDGQEEAASKVEFVGWSSDGASFAVETWRGLDAGELAGRRQIHLREVRDARTGALVAAFRVEADLDDEVPADDPLRRMWAAAKPEAAWDGFVLGAKLVPESSAPQDAELSAVAVGETIPALSRVGVEHQGLVTTVEWRSWPKPRSAAEKAALATKAQARRSEMAPAVDLVLERGEGSWRVLRWRAPYQIGLLDEARVSDDDAVVRGTLTQRWSPAGDRVVFLSSWEARGLSSEMVLPDASFVIRTAGPQIEVVAGDATRLAELVNRIEGSGLAVSLARLAPGEVQGGDTRVTYRQGAAPIAGRIAELVGAKAPTSVATDDWAQVVVSSGSPAP